MLVGDPVLYARPPAIGLEDQRRLVDAAAALDRAEAARTGDPELTTRIAQYEMAFRMQTSVRS